MSAFDIVAVLKQQAEEITSKGIKGWGNTMLYAAEELAKLRAELKNRPVRVMTQEEYKEYLSEQDRIKREAEEMAGEALTLIRKLQDD